MTQNRCMWEPWKIHQMKLFFKSQAAACMYVSLCTCTLMNPELKAVSEITDEPSNPLCGNLVRLVFHVCQKAGEVISSQLKWPRTWLSTVKIWVGRWEAFCLADTVRHKCVCLLHRRLNVCECVRSGGVGVGGGGLSWDKERHNWARQAEMRNRRSSSQCRNA